MKNFFGFLVLLISLIFVPCASAVTFNVVVLPADILRVCENYYCYPEVSEIVAEDLVNYFNATGKIKSPTVTEVRRTLSQNPNVKPVVKSAADKYNLTGNIDYASLKQLARLFSANSVLLISNSVSVEGASRKRSVWEILELASGLNISYPFIMETDAVLIDTVNDLVMWRGGYTKGLNTSDGSFSAQKASQSYAKYAYLQSYSEDILSKAIAQNVILRFFPKTVSPVLKQDSNLKPSGNFFRYESTNPTSKKLEEEEEEPLEHNYGEMIYGL